MNEEYNGSFDRREFYFGENKSGINGKNFKT